MTLLDRLLPWPDVPETEAEQAAYIVDPTAWDFYP